MCLLSALMLPLICDYGLSAIVLIMFAVNVAVVVIVVAVDM